jgi:hypothetical protein
VTERIRSGGSQALGGALLCAVDGCPITARVEDCLCYIHANSRDARTEAMRQIAVKGGFVTEGLSFGDAIVALKAGKKVARAGWNGKGMWLALQVPDAHSKMSLPYIYMKTADDKLVPWLASQTDMLADDWSVLS